MNLTTSAFLDRLLGFSDKTVNNCLNVEHLKVKVSIHKTSEGPHKFGTQKIGNDVLNGYLTRLMKRESLESAATFVVLTICHFQRCECLIGAQPWASIELTNRSVHTRITRPASQLTPIHFLFPYVINKTNENIEIFANNLVLKKLK